jgi:hypothetical protein
MVKYFRNTETFKPAIIKMENKKMFLQEINILLDGLFINS